MKALRAEHVGLFCVPERSAAMLDLSLTIFGRYITLHIGRLQDAVWEDDEDDPVPTEDPRPVDEDPASLTKDATCVYMEEAWYE